MDMQISFFIRMQKPVGLAIAARHSGDGFCRIGDQYLSFNQTSTSPTSFIHIDEGIIAISISKHLSRSTGDDVDLPAMTGTRYSEDFES